MTPDECAAWLTERDNFLIVTHVRPDGDTIGSAAALCLGLRHLGKNAYLFDNPGVTKRYLPFFTQYTAPEGFSQDFVISVDMAAAGMKPDGFDGDVDLSIDHHASNTFYARGTFLRGNRAACGELILELLGIMDVDIDKEIAELLYIAVSTDTGCFSYSNTTASTLRAASELTALGADIAKLNKLLFRTATAARIALEGMIYSGISLHEDGLIAVAVITLDMAARANATEIDFEDIANLPGRVDGVLISITMRETAPNSLKASVRTHGGISAAAICKKFGGGGHEQAAGCDFGSCATDEAKARIIGAAVAELRLARS